jgi:RimJ/RimL family protein N-acetyltransferase
MQIANEMSESSGVERWLLAQDWPALERHFAAHAPATAADYHARSLLRLAQPAERIDWRAVVDDMREAVARRPLDAALRANLTQALLDGHRPLEALQQARQLLAIAPEAPAADEKLLAAATGAQRWDEALDALQRAQRRLGGQPPPPSIARFADELASRWWQPVEAGGIVLRKPDDADAGFVEACFADRAFMRRYHRFQPAGAAAAKRFVAASKLSPRRSHRIDWIVEGRDHAGLGLAGLVEIDWANARAELLVGLPGRPLPTAALKATVALLAFAFHRLRLAKLVSHVYADNPDAQANTLHLGFAPEGLLKRHVADGDARVDLHANGMLREDYLANPMLASLTRRWTTFA